MVLADWLAADFTGDNPLGYSTVFWSNITGTVIGQPLRDATTPSDVESRNAGYPQISNDGGKITFRSGTNYVPGTETNKEKIYIIDRI